MNSHWIKLENKSLFIGEERVHKEITFKEKNGTTTGSNFWTCVSQKNWTMNQMNKRAWKCSNEYLTLLFCEMLNYTNDKTQITWIFWKRSRDSGTPSF